ncbi:hypothetical protein SU69_03345 [Thermosipho melanesiensis]|uniref:Uncharacterized protein n=2 Tax=Thermosipho melanesiensis TaxID=46541 RepID=A6LKR0_THEM4|nr:hypothetical protein [Thermosipho melanesiensis]ABR30511.1 hypothetical protein Tmel_0647 [Thermosipho melanesiensis BI429]APT73662.1 hypothetical protein BW47_03525 [Thermosipho melanesiensis]OOC35603.1 hypothetical protein SU68_03400 [Thermosipho melanesiensis]OOC39277.1 hypothetical protein SU69_03345 [Thermosipho melanesiensis]OOC39363.1 hypothetical protein SU70_03345 [Thermosipho melanesiensis]
MKMPPEMIKAQENMRPGVITAEGFLGDDDRGLMDIIMDDEREMAKLGLDFEYIAKIMRKFLRIGEKGLGEPIKHGNFEIFVYEARGFIPCPFEDGIFRKKVVTIENLENKEKIMYSELSIHLLEKHHFLQGEGAKFRLEPKKLKKVFLG